MKASEALIALAISCIAIVAGVAMIAELAWALIIGGALLMVVTVLLYDSQANERRAKQRRVSREGGFRQP